MSLDDYVGVIGAALSSIMVTIGFLWSIGVLQLVFSFLTGAFTTYFVQRKLQMDSEKRKIRRENIIQLREKIYGPIYEQLCGFLQKLLYFAESAVKWRYLPKTQLKIGYSENDIRPIFKHCCF